MINLEKKDLVVVKVGTGVLTKKGENGQELFNQDSFKLIGQQIIDLISNDTYVTVVTSAAITGGMIETGTLTRPNKDTSMPELQRLASIGNRLVCNMWAEALKPKLTGSILLTRNELDRPGERSEAVSTICTLFAHGEIPIINENDAIAHEEIKIGDNDTLSAELIARLGRLAIFGDATLVILSNIDGVYVDYKNKIGLIPTIQDINRYKHLAQDTGDQNCTGGMRTKFIAAEIVTQQGIKMVVANGLANDAIRLALLGKMGTTFEVTK